MNSNPLHITNQSTFEAYPITCFPILKSRIWGGEKLKTLGKNLPNKSIGESWELSMIGEDISVVKNGVYQYTSIDILINNFPKQILGEEILERFGPQLPLLFKFLDAKTDLSIQLHPNDTLAKERHNSYGKTEMWYIMEAEEDARIILGFNQDSSSEEYLTHLENKTLPTILREYKVKKGDVFFIETGTVHAIGGGVLLAEIQQTSDITYRIYDWDRVDDNGVPRELHIDLALDAINYESKDSKIVYKSKSNTLTKLVESPFFKTNFLPLDGELRFIKEEKLYVYICTHGEFSIEYLGEIYTFEKGDTILIPAVVTEFILKGKAELLEIYI